MKRKSVSATECYRWHGANALFDNSGPEDRSAVLRETVTGDQGNRLFSPLALAALNLLWENNSFSNFNMS